MGMSASSGPLHLRLKAGPLGSSDKRMNDALAELESGATGVPGAKLLSDPVVSALLRGILSGSPYLSGLMLRKPERLLKTLTAVPEHELDALLARVQRTCVDLATAAEVMSELRSFKSEIALLVAIADLGGV